MEPTWFPSPSQESQLVQKWYEGWSGWWKAGSKEEGEKMLRLVSGEQRPSGRPAQKREALLDEAPKVWSHQMCPEHQADPEGRGNPCRLWLQHH